MIEKWLLQTVEMPIGGLILMILGYLIPTQEISELASIILRQKSGD